ncbi:MAG: methyltransferase domain-containing protein [Gammaproteobacteria bacterium]|nr:methyltransferase domain-containing protein [Gammaproteobacteria bacterium]
MKMMQKLEKAYDLLRTQAWQEASVVFEAVLALEPHSVLARRGLGTAEMMQEKYASAKLIWSALLQEALEDKAKTESYFALGSIAYQEKNFSLAIQYLLEVCRIYPTDIEATRQIAWAYIEIKEYETALKWCEKLMALSVDKQAVFYNKGVVLMHLSRWSEAIQSFEQVMMGGVNYLNAQLNLAFLSLKLNKISEGIAYYQSVLNISPAHPIAQYQLSALLSEKNCIKAPCEFISTLYDAYAENYDNEMKSQLNYQVPYLFLNVIRDCVGVKKANWVSLDLGCGTGLAAEILKDFSEDIIGVDISEKMLAIAKNKNCYTELWLGDMLSFFDKNERKFDLIYAADSLIYRGDLKPLFEKIQSALESGGLFVFSVEKTNENNFFLQKTGRFSHNKEYVRHVLCASGLTVMACRDLTLRDQGGQAVEGEIWLASKE